jgi:hypothetical protein
MAGSGECARLAEALSPGSPRGNKPLTLLQCLSFRQPVAACDLVILSDPKRTLHQGQGRVMNVDRIGSASDAAPGGGGLGRFVEQPGQPKIRPAQPRRRPLWVFLSLSGCAIAGVILAQGDGQALVANPPSTLFSHVAFVENERLAPMLSFNPPEAVRGQAHYQARVREGLAERRDTLTYADAGADDFLFRVTLHSAKSALAKPSLFVELAKQSAELGAAVIRATSPQPYLTPRGPVEWAGVTLSGPKGERSCLGFRFARTREIDLSGTACGGHGSPLSPVALGCLIDRLSPTAAGMEAGLGEVLKSDPTRAMACRRIAG